MIRFILGFVCFVFAVFQPMRANLLSAITAHTGIDPIAQITLLEYAIKLDPCNVGILDKIGILWAQEQKYPMSAIAFGKAVTCSPGNAEMRFKYGEAIVLTGYPEGVYSIADAVRLEPNNPIYKGEQIRLTARLPR